MIAIMEVSALVPELEQASEQTPLGQAILDSLHSILRRCEEAGERVGFPGEGGERSFRAWLVSDLLCEVFGWPVEKVVVGERFDVLLQDADGFPVVTIETKTPYHQASKAEREQFEKRLSGFGTLRSAFITNGQAWDRLDIFAPTGEAEIQNRLEFNLSDATPEQAEAFFAPLEADRHLRGTPRVARHEVSGDHPHILRSLAADLNQCIADFAFLFQPILSGLHDRRAGEDARGYLLNLFDQWCQKSLIVSPRQAGEQLAERFRTAERFREADIPAGEFLRIVSDVGFTGADAATASDALIALAADQRCEPSAIAEALWPAYAASVKKLCAQTAHVLLARALLYRVGEDQLTFSRLLSGEQMERSLLAVPGAVTTAPLPATDLLRRVRLEMQDFLPAVYLLGEFDWWLVEPDKRPPLKPAERAWLRNMDVEFERVAQRLLRVLNGYFFGHVDVDVWRNVYQHYLPADERQRLGGFYTPDDLVGLVLDLAEFDAETEGLCQLSFIDPASGSGAFVTGALARLLKHLELDLPCHAELHERGRPEWKRAEAILNIAARNLHAVDLHPFAAFLTTINALFLLMPLYVKARQKNPNFLLDLQIFSSDSLEKHDEDLLEPDLFSKLNSRVQLTEDSFRRYQEMLQVRFDRVFGNPPWGGVLKGPLSPVYDTMKKARFAREFKAAAQGKYDVYGLFIERSLQILKPGGRFGMLTQGTFIDKEWAAGLRELLTSRCKLRFIVDLNPFGQLFFHAMNTPCITVADALRDGDGKGECTAVLSTPPDDFGGLERNERLALVVSTVQRAIKKVSSRQKAATVGFAHAARVSIKRLRETADHRWNLSAVEQTKPVPKGWMTAADLLEMRQGVTPGGCLELFLMPESQAKSLGLEEALVHRAVKSKELERWRVDWSGLVLFYPYHMSEGESAPAFTIDPKAVRDKEVAETMRRLGVVDALDFNNQLDRREQEVIRRRGVNQQTVPELLKHRIGLRLVKYPAAAEYLAEHYERLEGRVFEKKRFTDMSKRWYEYHRPRDPKLMLSRKRIVSPTLVRHVRFSLDSVGFLSDHACQFIQPTDRTHEHYSHFSKQLASTLARRVTLDDALKYCLAFLNSGFAQERLIVGRRPTPKGFYAVTEDYLREIPIPPPRSKKSTAAILDLVTRLIRATDEAETARLEKNLGKVVSSLLGG